MMTYRELLTLLAKKSSGSVLMLGGEEWLDDDVTVRFSDMDEFFQVSGIAVSEDGSPADGILDAGHIYLETLVVTG